VPGMFRTARALPHLNAPQRQYGPALIAAPPPVWIARMRHAASFFEAFPVDPRTRETTPQYIERVWCGGWLQDSGTALDAG
jgi:hypothetical protein